MSVVHNGWVLTQNWSEDCQEMHIKNAIDECAQHVPECSTSVKCTKRELLFLLVPQQRSFAGCSFAKQDIYFYIHQCSIPTVLSSTIQIDSEEGEFKGFV